MQQVQERGQTIYIRFLPNRQPLFITIEAQEQQDKTSTKDLPDDLVMREGETVSVGDGLHSGCEMTVERRVGQLGLKIKSFTILPGLPANVGTDFIPATTQADL